MRKEIRRRDRIMEYDQALEVLKECEYGTLSMINDEHEPYGIPISFVLVDKYLYFHSALSGYKMDNFKLNNQVSFSCVGKTQPIYAKNFTTYFQSVIVYGKIEFIEDDEIKREALEALCIKYLPNDMDKFEENFEMSKKFTAVYHLSIENLSAKEKKAK
ncbi:MAG: pyridoxamine 5'-phosphate oxidase family protein [Erysipelotrichales bacterium]